MNRIFIINPTSGRTKSIRYKRIIKHLMAKYKKNEKYTINETTKPNDITRIINQNINENDENVVYVFGGDGTINEALYAVIKNKVSFVPVPTGTGNDYVKSVCNFRTPRKIILESFKDEYKKVDVMLTTKGYAANIVNFGFDAQVADNIKYFRKIPLLTGKARYNLSILLSLFFNKNYKFKIRVDNEIRKGYYTLCAVGKGKYYGGGIMVLPKAKVSDKKLYVCLIKSTTILDKLKFLPILKEGKHPKENIVEMIECKNFSIVSYSKFPIAIDGELHYTNKFKINILPQVMKVLK